MNGQRFHQQKRIEMKTGQCERSLSAPCFIDSLIKGFVHRPLKACFLPI